MNWKTFNKATFALAEQGCLFLELVESKTLRFYEFWLTLRAISEVVANLRWNFAQRMKTYVIRLVFFLCLSDGWKICVCVFFLLESTFNSLDSNSNRLKSLTTFTCFLYMAKFAGFFSVRLWPFKVIVSSRCKTLHASRQLQRLL